MTTDSSTPLPARSALRDDVIGIGALLLLLGAQLWWSWRRWPDLLVDFGRELYLPWQLSEGRVLYADITYLNGPLSPYLNASLFEVFGVSFRTLIAANLVVLLAVAALIWSLLCKTGSRLAAFASTLAFISVFALGHYAGIGNYNFMSPYYHEATHGTLLSLVAIAAMSRGLRSSSRWPVALAALAVGLVALTKIEILLAAGAAAIAFLALLPAERRARAVATFALVVPLPYLVATALLAAHMPFSGAARATLGSLAFVAGSDIEKNLYYKTVTGLDDPIVRLSALALATTVFALALASAVGLARVIGRDATGRFVRGLAWGGLGLIAAGALALGPDQCARALPAATAAALAWLVSLSRRGEPCDRERLHTLTIFATFALFSLLKMGLAPRIAHYGFFLAMPAFVLGAALLVSLVPARFAGSARGAAALRLAAIAFVILLGFRHIELSRSRYVVKTMPVGPPADAVVGYHPMLDPRTGPAARATAWLDSTLAPTESFVAIPEGLMLNFLTRRPNPTRYLTFTYPEILAFGEDAMADDIRRTSPDYIVLVHRDASEYGVGMWGQDPRYGQRTMTWIEANYRPVVRFRDEPFVDPRAFGIKILKRR